MGLAGSPGWAVASELGHLVVTAGADAVWLLEDVPGDVAQFVARFWSDAPPLDVPDPAKPVVAQLTGLGALRPAQAGSATPPGNAFRLVFAGDPIDLGLAADPADPKGLTVVVRTNASLLDAADAAADLTTPHVLVDLAYQHTVVLGPYVFPGDTACLACLAGRVGTRWGDPAPPTRPGAMDDARLAGMLLARAVRGTTLVNATVSIDLDDLSTQREPLWPAPGCPACRPWRTDGAIALPWSP
jgi:hypothetical protein